MKLSAKKQAELYDLVHNEIIEARVKIWKISKNNPVLPIEEIDAILSKVCYSAPQKAIDLFSPKP